MSTNPLFQCAVTAAATELPSSLSYAQKGEIYGLYKVSTVSATPTSARPGFFDQVGRGKWDAWTAAGANGGKSADQAQTEYIALVEQLSGKKLSLPEAPASSSSSSSSTTESSSSSLTPPAPPAAPAAPAAIDCTEMVVISYADLVAASHPSASPELLSSLQSSVSAAFGYDGMGILAVSGVPSLSPLRARLLPLAARFAALPEEAKRKTETPHAFYQVGWSYGNEKLQGDKPDFAKGSYYCNPLVDRPFDDEALIKKYPSFLEPNIWPTEDLPDFEPAFKALGQAVVAVGRLLAKQCDEYVQNVLGDAYVPGRFFKLLTESKCCKGRLLHYYPSDEVCKMMEARGVSAACEGGDMDNDFSDWCGWHNDHGSLTGLVPAMYFDRDVNPVPNPDPQSGLYVRSRHGRLVQVKMPASAGPDAVAFQIGETSQIHTGGVLQATPHAVRGAFGDKAAGISRDTFAVFMEPEFDGDMTLPRGKTGEDVQSSEAVGHLPKTVKTLMSRWREGMDFGEFSDATFSAFY